MKIIWKYIFIISVVHLLLPMCVTSFLHQTVNGSLTESWKFNFTLFVKVFKGVILHCGDSDKNNFIVAVRRESDHNRSIYIAYNKIWRYIPLKSLCGCDPCDGTMINLQIQRINNLINIGCNNHNSEELTIGGIKNDSIKGTNTMTITIGKDVANIMNFDKRWHMIACLETFYYGGSPVIFQVYVTEILSRCPRMCNNNTCNNGICQERMLPDGPRCDCFNTALNGRYCNRSMKIYGSDVNKSYITKYKDNIHIKFTWKQLLYKHYCLMDIIGRDKHVTISINNNQLMIDSNSISDYISHYNVDSINFATVIIRNNYLDIKTNNNNNVKQFDFLQSIDNSIIQINIGFSERFTSCVTFEGAFDIDFGRSQIQPLTRINTTNIHSYTTNIQNYTTNILNKMELNEKRNIQWYIFGGILGLCVAFVTTMYLIFRHQLKRYMTSFRDTINDRRNHPSVVFTNPGDYDTVKDNNNYDYIGEVDYDKCQDV